MEKKNPNIYQRALDIVNNRINPDIPQGGGGGSSDAVQYIPQVLTEAQQMQARKNQGLYYEEDTFGYLLEETTLTFDEPYGDKYIYDSVPLVVGENYILERDGEEYEVVAELYDGTYVSVGFSPSEEVSEDDPKVCIISLESEGMTIFYEAEEGTHTYAIKGDMHVLSAIDKKYVQPVIDDYMIVMKPTEGLIINWDGDVSEREKIWDEYEDKGWVKIADDVPDNAAWIGLATIKYGKLEEDGSWTTTSVDPGSHMYSIFNGYVLDEWGLVFVCDECITIPETEYTLTHGVWTYCRTYEGQRLAYHEIEFPSIDAPIMRFAGAGGAGEGSFICGRAAAALTTGRGSVNGGRECEVSGDYSTTFGRDNKVLSDESFANGYNNTVKAYCSTAEGSDNIVGGRYSHVEGEYNESQFDYQHIEGQYAEKYDVENVPEYDSSKTYYPGDMVSYSNFDYIDLYYCLKECTDVTPWYYSSDNYWTKYNPLVHVVGWGDNYNSKNIHTIDSLGNAMYTGDVTAKSMIIQSSTPDSTKKFKITVNDSGEITATEVT